MHKTANCFSCLHSSWVRTRIYQNLCFLLFAFESQNSKLIKFFFLLSAFENKSGKLQNIAFAFAFQSGILYDASSIFAKFLIMTSLHDWYHVTWWHHYQKFGRLLSTSQTCKQTINQLITSSIKPWLCQLWKPIASKCLSTHLIEEVDKRFCLR